MRLTRWPTASCISRAIRVRSLSTASRAMQLALGLGALGALGERGQEVGAGPGPGADRAGQQHDERGAAERRERLVGGVDGPGLDHGDGGRRRRPRSGSGQSAMYAATA